MRNETYNGKKITLRPSSIDAFYNCPHQWFDIHVLGNDSTQGARAGIGTSVHSGAEAFWSDAMKTGIKDLSNPRWSRVACTEMKKLHDEGLRYDVDENLITAICEVSWAMTAYLRDIAPNVAIPDAVEQRFSINLDHPIVKRVSGTIDYIAQGFLDDVKTSRKKPVPKYYTVQQSIYKILAQENGHKIHTSRIQGIAFTKKVKGHLLTLEPNIEEARSKVNHILAVLREWHEGGDQAKLFPEDSGHFLCKEKFCHLYKGCETAKNKNKAFNPFESIEETADPFSSVS